jgi:hypothetical protein
MPNLKLGETSTYQIGTELVGNQFNAMDVDDYVFQVRSEVPTITGINGYGGQANDEFGGGPGGPGIVGFGGDGNGQQLPGPGIIGRAGQPNAHDMGSNGVEGSGTNGGSGVFGQGPSQVTPGAGVTGAGGQAFLGGVVPAPGAAGVSGQGGDSLAQNGPAGPVAAGAGPGVSGKGGDASAILGGEHADVPIEAAAAPGVTGVGGSSAIQSREVGDLSLFAIAAAGPGVVGQGGGLPGGQEGGSGVVGSGIVGVAGDASVPRPAIGGYGGVFTSASHAQVHLVPAELRKGPEAPPLPSTGQAGDLFARALSDGRAELWFCISPTENLPDGPVVWNRVAFDLSSGPG